MWKGSVQGKARPKMLSFRSINRFGGFVHDIYADIYADTYADIYTDTYANIY